MYLPGIDTQQQVAKTDQSDKPKVSHGDLFAVLLQGVQSHDANVMRFAGGFDLKRDTSEKLEPTPQPAIENQQPQDDDRTDVTAKSDRREDDSKERADNQDVEVEDDTAIASVQNAHRLGSFNQLQTSTAQSVERAASANSAQQSVNAQGAAAVAERNAATGTLPGNKVIGNAAAETSAGDGNTNGQPKISVTDDGANLHSKPTTALASKAAVTVQSEANAAAARNNGPVNSALNGGNIVLNAAAAKEASATTSNKTPLAPPAAQPEPVELPGKPSNAANAVSAALAKAPAAARSGLENASVKLGQPTVESTGGSVGTANSNGGPLRADEAAPRVPTRPQVPPKVVTEQIAVQIKRAVGEGVDKIRIQLKPADLGRVEVKLEVGSDGRTTAIVTAERPETLELLQRDSRGLQQALQDAGLKADSGSLSFNLNGQNSGQKTAGDGQPESGDPSSRQGGDGDVAHNDSNETGEAPRRTADGLIDVEV